MPIGSSDSIIYNIDGIQDNQILVYDAATGSFKNETAAVSANSSVTGQGRNVGTYGVGLYKQNDSQYLEFYKLQAGSNATIALNDNVITIDAVVGSGSLALGTANASTILVTNTDGNIASGSDSLTFDGTTFNFIGAANNVTVANGLVTSNNLVTTNLTFGGMVMPTADGTAGYVLATDGSNNLDWVARTDISGKVDSTTFNAHVAQAMFTTSSNAPALDNTYDLGNTTNKYNEIFSTYFRGTADISVNAQNLGSQPAANYRLAADSYTKAEVDSAVAGATSDSQDLTISGNIISLTGQTGNVDITSLLVAGNYTNADVDTHLNQSNPTSGYVLSWNGSDYAWVAQSGGGGGGSSTLAGLSDTPSNFSGAGGKYLKVNSGATAVEFDTLSLTDLSITDGTANQVLKTDGAGNFSFTNQTGGSDQTLTWNAGTYALGISSGNSIDLSALAQDISLSGNVISLSLIHI